MPENSKKNSKIKFNIGSLNPAKVNAAEKAFSKIFGSVEVSGFDIDSKVSPQPKSMEEIVKGAENRAKGAFEKGNCGFGVGIEAGIFKFPGRTGYMDICITAVFDGKEFFYGGSPVFEYPKFIIDKIFNEKMEVGHILDEHLNTKNIKHGKGAIGWLSEGKMNRDEYVELSVMMSAITLKNKGLY